MNTVVKRHKTHHSWNHPLALSRQARQNAILDYHQGHKYKEVSLSPHHHRVSLSLSNAISNHQVKGSVLKWNVMQVAALCNRSWVGSRCSWLASHSFSLGGRGDSPWAWSRRRKARSPPSAWSPRPCPPRPMCRLSSPLQSREAPLKLQWLLTVRGFWGYFSARVAWVF